MATVATREVMAYRMQARELGHGPHGHAPLYLDATAVFHRTATGQISREMKYLAARLAIVQEARAHGKIRTMKIDECLHPAGILTKPLAGRGIRQQAGADPRARRGGAATAEGPVGRRRGLGRRSPGVRGALTASRCPPKGGGSACRCGHGGAVRAAGTRARPLARAQSTQSGRRVRARHVGPCAGAGRIDCVTRILGCAPRGAPRGG